MRSFSFLGIFMDRSLREQSASFAKNIVTPLNVWRLYRYSIRYYWAYLRVYAFVIFSIANISSGPDF